MSTELIILLVEIGKLAVEAIGQIVKEINIDFENCICYNASRQK